MMKKTNRKSVKANFRAGSALILAVVLTTLLAIIGVTFVMSARVDRMATASVSENKELNYAVESVVTKISQLLAVDVPGVSGHEYYDYPAHNITEGPDAVLGTFDDDVSLYGSADDIWLADLEPVMVDVAMEPPTMDTAQYGFGHISDVYGQLAYLFQNSYNTGTGQLNYRDSDGDRISFRNLRAIIIKPDEPIKNEGDKADADGDGVADSRWVILPDVTSSKGKPVYAAIRIIDNCAMININTAHKFESTSIGSAHTDIDLKNVTKEDGLSDVAVDLLHQARVGTEDPLDLAKFQNDCIWEIEIPNGDYLPFDISDELELRNRFFMDSPSLIRLEAYWEKTFLPGYPTQLKIPYNNPDKLPIWFTKASDGSSGHYTRRHICTTYNMDRIIDPNGNKMININTASKELIFDALVAGIDLAVADVDALAAQLTANIIDFRDNDANVTIFDNGSGTKYYGFEAQPFISEIGIKIDAANPDVSANNHFAVELYNPFDVSISLDDFTLSISDGTDIDLTGSTIGPESFFVIADDISAFTLPGGITTQEDINLKLSDNYVDLAGDPTFETYNNYNITLIHSSGTDIINIDEQNTQNDWFEQGFEKYVQRDDNNWHVVDYTDFDPNLGNTLGAINNYNSPTAKNYNIGLANKDFATIGDVVLPLAIGQSSIDANSIGRQLGLASAESDIRLDLTNPDFQQIFQYLTVFDPNDHGQDPNETRIKGRININTAPWFVMAQLPWMTEEIAQTVANFRSTNGSFENIGELNNVVDFNEVRSIDYYGRNSEDLTDFPDITPEDGAIDDFEERDIIFSRISNLVTVRSDVFTAYILVRIGADGPQKRVIAIFDRSNVFSANDKPKLVALHPVPDPR